ncbi:MAG: hypothetical protein ACJ8EL_11255 [Rhizomicrobium sp.]
MGDALWAIRDHWRPCGRLLFGWGDMEKVRQLRRRAKECRDQAAKAPNSDLKSHYEELANVWDKLAEERLTFFVEHPEADTQNEVAEAEAS